MKNKLFNEYAMRFSNKQKKKFRKAAKEYIEELGYDVIEHKTIYGTNLYFGNDKSNYTVTAHYDTATNMAMFYPFMKFAGVRYGQFLVLLPFFIILKISNIAFLLVATVFLVIVLICLLIPNKYNYNDNSSGVLSILIHAEQNKNDPKFFYALTDNEEKGLFGAKALKNYLKARKLKSNRIINLDCVGIGDRLLLVHPTDSNHSKMIYEKLAENMQIDKMKSKLLASDHLLFGEHGLMLTRVNNPKLGNKDVYIPNLHTNKDREIDMKHVFEVVEALKYIEEL